MINLPMPTPSGPTIDIADSNWGVSQISDSFYLNSLLLQDQLTDALKALQGPTGATNPHTLATYQSRLAEFNANKAAQAKSNETIKEIALFTIRAI